MAMAKLRDSPRPGEGGRGSQTFMFDLFVADPPPGLGQSQNFPYSRAPKRDPNFGNSPYVMRLTSEISWAV